MTDMVLDDLSTRATTVLRDAVDGPITADTVRNLTRRYLLATYRCGPIIADEIIGWAKGRGIIIED